MSLSTCLSYFLLLSGNFLYFVSVDEPIVVHCYQSPRCISIALCGVQFWRFWQVHDVLDQLFQFRCPKDFLCSIIYSSLLPMPKITAITNLFTPIVPPFFQECHIVEVIQYVDFSDYFLTY